MADSWFTWEDVQTAGRALNELLDLFGIDGERVPDGNYGGTVQDTLANRVLVAVSPSVEGRWGTSLLEAEAARMPLPSVSSDEARADAQLAVWGRLEWARSEIREVEKLIYSAVSTGAPVERELADEQAFVLRRAARDLELHALALERTVR